VEDHRSAFLSLIRGAHGGDDALRSVVDRTYEVVAGRVIEGLEVDPTAAPPLLRIAVRGAVAFIEEAVVTWLAEPGASRDGLLAVLDHVVLEAVAAAGAPVPGPTTG
jgi:hypothetical protein